jgi:CubicO group peptidase (beta-lactamase class C family)
MRTMVALAFAFLSISPSIAAQTDQQAVDQLFAAYEKSASPGCSLGVIRDESFVYSKGYGLASLELGGRDSRQ